MWRAIRRLFRKRHAPTGRIWFDTSPRESYLCVWRSGAWQRAPTAYSFDFTLEGFTNA